MKKQELDMVLMDQKEDLEMMRGEEYCHRRQEALIDLDSHMAQVVIGVRRSGKSTLCLNALEHAGVNYAYVNFDDERLTKFTSEDLDQMLEALYRIYGNFDHLFLDEVQNVDGWHLFVNRMLRRRMHMVITGSNSKLLSSELATHLTGRHHTIELLPFSFADYCAINKVETSGLTTKKRGLLMRAFDRYMEVGGFPELLTEKDHKAYIDSLVKGIVSRDIVDRFGVRNGATLMQLTNHLLNNAPCLIVRRTLQQAFGISSNHTVENYLSYLEQTYLTTSVHKYSTKSSERTVNLKSYTIDVALMNQRPNAMAGENLRWRLETMVYLELRKRTVPKGEDIYYWASRQAEVDFVVCKGNNAEAIYQVSYDISSPKTRQRELRGLVAAQKATRCQRLYLITNSEREEYTTPDGLTVHIVPACEWAVEE